MEAMLPHLSAMHPMHPDHVHEEIELQLPDFSSYQLEWVARAPRWRDYYLAHDQTPHYAYMKTVLQILQWRRPGERWVLKSPQHLEQLGPLLATFPDATVVVTHRDPVAVVQSTVTMACYGARTALPHDPTRWYRDYWTDRIGACSTPRCATATSSPRDRTGTCSSTSSWRTRSARSSASTARRADAHRRSPGRDRRLPRAHPRGKEGQVVYDLRRDFAVTPDEVRTRFGFYLDAFPVRIEVR